MASDQAVLVCAQSLLVHRAVRVVTRLLLRSKGRFVLLMWRLSWAWLPKVVVQLPANAAFASNESVFKDLRVVVCLPAGLLLFLDYSHNKGFKCFRNVVGLADAHMVHPEKSMTIDPGKLLKLFATL